MKRLKAISLFSGCGGSDLALVRAGFHVVWANDVWDVACQTYRDNFANPRIVCGDIKGFHKFPKADLLIGCYPCQGYSQGGRRDPDEGINYLYRRFDRVLRIVAPRAFVVENVNGMAYGRNYNLLMNQVCRFRLAGYRVVWKVLDGKDYGLAQTRRRVFIVGMRSDISATYKFPEPTHGPGQRLPFRSQRDVIGSMPDWPADGYCREKLHWYYLSRNRRHTWTQPSPCIVGHWRHVPLHPASTPLRRIHTDKWEFTRKGRARRFNYLECAALQGFPRSFKWRRGSIRDRFQMIGNAVPPPMFNVVLSGLRHIW